MDTKHIIFDTDIGIDSDDAVALSVLLSAEAQGRIKIDAIGAATERKGATATVKAICQSFGREIPLGRLIERDLECDKIDIYALPVMEKYGTTDTDADAVGLYRKTLAEAKEKLTLIAVGPLALIRQLFESSSDEHSPLHGIELVREKVDKIYIMGGAFYQNNRLSGKAPEYRTAEWNIRQDIAAAKFVAENSPVYTLWCPYEAGYSVYAYASDVETPTNYAMKVLSKHYKEPEDSPAKRDCWDPITCLAAIDDISEFFDVSDAGIVEVNEKGETNWRCGDGVHRFLILREGYKKCADRINAILRDAEASMIKKQAEG